jgi:PEP-CTERM motif
LTLIVSMVDFRELIGEKYPSTLLRDPYEVTKMRSAILTAIVLTLAMAFSSTTATASTSNVTLTLPTTGSITFTGGSSPGSALMTVTGPLSGVASMGTGAFSGATSFTLLGSVVFTATSGDSDGYAGTGVLNFATNNGFTGTLSNITLDQTIVAGVPGSRVQLTATLNGQTVSVTLDLPSSTPISGLGSHTELGKFSVGEAGSAVTPEPGTMLLFGSGLLLVAGVLRRRLIA